MGGSKKMQQVRSIANRPSGGGNKKQGLPPSIGRPGWFNNMVRTRAGGYFRDIPGPAQEVISKTVGEFNNAVRALQLDATGSYLYVGGAFTKYTSPTNVETNVNAIAKIRLSDGALVPAFVGAGEGFSGGGGDGGVIALQLSGTYLYVGGFFNSYINVAGGGTPKYIAKLNATTGALITGFVKSEEGFSGDSGIGGGVFALQLSGTNLYVGGGFDTYINVDNVGGNYKTPLNIAKLNANTGELITDFVGSGEGFGGGRVGVGVVALQLSGTDLYVGGFFNSYINVDNVGGNYKTPLNIAKLNATDGKLDLDFVKSGEGFSGDAVIVVAALQLSGTDLYVGGNFNSYINDGQTVTPKHIAKLNATDGKLDLDFVKSGEGFRGDVYLASDVDALQLSGTNLYVGGGFNSYINVAGGGTPKYIAKLNATNGALNK